MIEYSREDIVKAQSIGLRLRLFNLKSKYSRERYELFMNNDQSYMYVTDIINEIKNLQKEYDDISR